MNGSEPSEGQRKGRVEICYNNTYGSVCDDFFNENAATVVCNGIGEFYTGKNYLLLDNICIVH